jgi:hypothetical protein
MCSGNLLFKLGLNENAEGLVEVVVAETIKDLFEETEGEELVGGGFGDTAGLEVKFLLWVDAGGGGTVRAAHVVGLNLETGQRVGLGFVA